MGSSSTAKSNYTGFTEGGVSRRRIIALLLGAGGGALGLTYFGSDSVMAASLSISDDSVTTDNGALQSLSVTIDSEVTWDGAENEPGSTDIKLEIAESDSSWTTIATDSPELTGLAGTYTYTFSSIDMLGNTGWKKPDFNATGDGSSKTTDLDARLTVETTSDIDGDGSSDSFTSSTGTFSITVNNEANSNSAGGSGSSNAGGTNQEP